MSRHPKECSHKGCTEAAMRGWRLCPAHLDEEEGERAQAEYDGPRGQLDRVSNLEEMKDWLKEHFHFGDLK